jgi:hypothetical protein
LPRSRSRRSLSPRRCRARDAILGDTAAAIKSGFVEDLGELAKFVALAEAFPPDSILGPGRRPLGLRGPHARRSRATRSSELVYAKPADLGSRRKRPVRTLSDKPQVIDHLKKGFAHAKQQIGALDAATLTGTRKVMGRDMSVVQIADGIGGDLHEHLGQLIAYARMNHIVPPWSK